MKMIAAECPSCRLIDDVSAACLLVEVGTAAGEHDNSCASWICDTCQTLVTLPVDLTALLELVAAGASVLDDAPDDDRPAHPEGPTDGPAFTRDDLLDFHQQLVNDAWPASLLGLEQP